MTWFTNSTIAPASRGPALLTFTGMSPSENQVSVRYTPAVHLLGFVQSPQAGCGFRLSAPHSSCPIVAPRALLAARTRPPRPHRRRQPSYPAARDGDRANPGWLSNESRTTAGPRTSLWPARPLRRLFPRPRPLDRAQPDYAGDDDDVEEERDTAQAGAKASGASSAPLGRRVRSLRHTPRPPRHDTRSPGRASEPLPDL